jgi:hypothetical protein
MGGGGTGGGGGRACNQGLLPVSYEVVIRMEGLHVCVCVFVERDR